MVQGKEDRIYMMKKWRGIIVLLWLFGAFFAVSSRAEASSGTIQFTTASSQVKKGDMFTVVCQVTSANTFLDTEFSIDYNAKILQFVSGGKKVSGSGGVLRVSSTGNKTATNKKTFSLQFVALKNGASNISVTGSAKVTDEEGNSFSVSSNRLSIIVSKDGNEQVSPRETILPKITPKPVKNGNNKLKSLKLTALSMSPEFTADTKEYTASVDCNTEILYLSFETENKKAGVQVQGNEGLKTGENKVRILVTAENGSRLAYNITVNKENQTETEERQNKEKAEDKDISFHISKKNNRIFLKNSYEFEVLETSELSNVPAGYIQSSIELNGISVPAFTMENDLGNNYLLLYLKGPTGESNIYQYDRAEQTLQRYTGSMIEKVNKGSGETRRSAAPIMSNYVFLGIITGLVIIILCMLIAMLKMAMKRREDKKKIPSSEKDIMDDLDF